jgi:hypothetical protein
MQDKCGVTVLNVKLGALPVASGLGFSQPVAAVQHAVGCDPSSRAPTGMVDSVGDCKIQSCPVYAGLATGYHSN